LPSVLQEILAKKTPEDAKQNVRKHYERMLKNLAEFDTLLRDLGLSRDGKIGLAAMPAILQGQAEFHGTWTGSLIDPHLSGKVTANQLEAEIPTSAKGGQPQYIHLDSAEATGIYSAARIDITRGLLRRGQQRIAVVRRSQATDEKLQASQLAQQRASAASMRASFSRVTGSP